MKFIPIPNPDETKGEIDTDNGGWASGKNAEVIRGSSFLMEELSWAVMIPAPSEKVIFKIEVFNSEREADARLKELKPTAYKILMKGEQE